MIQQAVILAAGKSSRFKPFGETGHKSELVIMGKPIIYRTLDSLAELGIEEAVVVVGKDDQHMQLLLEKYPKKFKHLHVVIQDKPRGQADALLSAREVLAERFVMLDSNMFEIDQYLPDILKKSSQMVLTVYPTEQPHLYGVVRLKDGYVQSVEEKPQTREQGLMRIVGIYVFNKAFIDLLASLKLSEYLMEEALDQYVKQDKVAVHVLDRPLSSLKYPWHLFDYKNRLFKHIKFSQADSAKIAKTAQIRGPLFIGEDAIIGDFAVVEGPAYIGEEAVVGRYSVMRAGSVLEAGAQIQAYTDLKDSIIMTGAHIHSGFIGNSIIGEDVRIGAGFITANRRLDRANIKAYVKDKAVDTKLSFFGTVIGHQAKLGIKVSTMPNVIIGNHALIGPAQVIRHNVDSHTKIA